MDCLFCKIIAGEIPSHKVYEDDQVLAFLDINPVHPGHTLVVPKKHSESLLDTDDEILARLVAVSKKVAQAIMTGLDYPSFNLIVNNGKIAGQIIPHLHFHVVPRKAEDGLKNWSGKEYADGEAEVIIEKLRKQT